MPFADRGGRRGRLAGEHVTGSVDGDRELRDPFGYERGVRLGPSGQHGRAHRDRMRRLPEMGQRRG